MVSVPSVGVVWNWRNNKNVYGLYSVHIRIKQGNTAGYYKVPVPKKVRAGEWSGKENAWVKSTHSYAFEINSKIIEVRASIQDFIKKNYAFNKAVTVAGIIKHLTYKGDNKSFLNFMERYIMRPPEKLALNTVKKYITTLAHLKKFRSTVLFAEIDNNLLVDFSRFMQMELNLGGAATKKYMEALKKVIRHARKENFISPAQMEFLFDGVKIRVEKAKRSFLDLAEIKKWKAVEFNNDQKHLERDRDLFLFQIYTGYYYKDLFIFQKEHLQQDEEYGTIIIGTRDKNGNQTIIPIFKFPHAGVILEKYKSEPDHQLVFDKKIFVEEQVYNRNLKEIAALAGIRKNISNKVARHTNAQLWIRFGAEGAVLSKMMGHAQQSTTKTYYDVNLPEIIEGTKRVNFEILGV